MKTVNRSSPQLLHCLATVALVAFVAGCVEPPPASPSASDAAAPSITTPASAPPRAAVATSAPPTAVAATPAPPPILQVPILPLDDAVLRAANDLFSKPALPAPGAGGAATQALVIDPLVDGISGVQSIATRSMESRITSLVRTKYPQFDVQPFSTSSIAKSPILLVGTFTTIDSKGQVTGTREAYRICLALADLRTGKIVAKGIARAQISGVDVTPLPYFNDSPVLAPDRVTEGYIKTCQATRVGDPIDPVYWDNIVAAALISDAINAYNNSRYQEALDLYKGVLRTPAGEQLRVYNGIYLASWRLGHRDDATLAFGKIVDYGLANNRLAVKFLFRPGSTQFLPDSGISGPYPVWLKQLALRTAQKQSCIDVVGHTSHTGPEPLNDRLSLLRAQYIKQRLETEMPQLKSRTRAFGRGSQENIVGIGTDDARDALDRRVEFKVAPC